MNWKIIHTPLILLLWHSSVLSLEPSALAPIKVKTILKTNSSWDGRPIQYPEGTPEITGTLVEIAPGRDTGWHSHPVPSVAMILEGELEVQLKDGIKKRFTAGEAVAEVVNRFHRGFNPGSVPVKILVFYIGTSTHPMTIKEAAQNNPPIDSDRIK